MTVGRLKKELEKYDDKLQVVIDDTDWGKLDVYNMSLYECDQWHDARTDTVLLLEAGECVKHKILD